MYGGGGGPITDPFSPRRVFVTDWQGLAGDDFQAYYYEQVGSYVPPTSNDPGRLGNPYPGLSNQQLWDQHGIAWAGSVAPEGAHARSGITGLVF